MKSSKKILVAVVIIFLGALALFVYKLPDWFLAKYGKNRLIEKLEEKWGGKWTIDSMDLNWYSYQKVSKIRWEKEKLTATAQEFVIRAPITTLMKNISSPQDLIGKYPMTLSNVAIYEGRRPLLTKIQTEIEHLKPKDLLTSIKGDPSSEQMSTILTGITHGGLRPGKIQVQMEDHSPYRFKIIAQNVPMRVFDLISNSEIPTADLIGSSISIDADGKVAGGGISLSFKLAANNLNASGSGLYKLNTFYPSSNLQIRTRINKSVSNYLFANSTIKPISLGNIQIDIAPEKTKIPLFPFQFSQFSASKINLDLGKMLLQNASLLSDILTILKKALRPNQDVPIWFQPAILSVDRGLIDLQRTDFLVDNHYQIASWGLINMRNSTFNMYLGITPYTLQEVFGFAGLPKNYVLPMRVDGPINNPDLHKSWALRTIAKIALLQSHPKLMGTYPKIDVKVPPERTPFPWQERGS